jgi:broad specificity phosphatase PhoE
MILVRHAESEWNRLFSRTRIDPGIPDPPLTATGRRQAAQLAERLAEAGVSRLVTSPYRRSPETATIVSKALGVAITVEPLIRERCVFSCDEGTSPGQLAALWPNLDFAQAES